jgi:hypothetical protein
MAADYVPRLRARSMERRAGSREKAQKINIEHRTPNIERRKRVGMGRAGTRSWENEIGDRQKRRR